LFNNTFAQRRVLVTGHTGFKGSWLTEWLLRLGAEVVGYSIDVPTTPSLFQSAGLPDRIDHHSGDIRDVDKLRTVIADCKPDFVFHMAAQPIVSLSYDDPLGTVSTNVLGTAAVLEALRVIDHACVAIIVASDKCYENVEQPWGYREIDPLGGKDVYSGSKGAAEIIFHSFCSSFFQADSTKVRLASVRAGNVIGGGDWAKDRIVVDCVRSWSTGQSVELRRPHSTRPWQHVLEPLSGYMALAEALSRDSKLHGQSFNFGPRAEQNRTVLELISDIAEIWGKGGAWTAADVPPFHEAGLLKLNCDKALLELQWQAVLTYAQCVTFTGEWYRDVVRDGANAALATANQIAQFEDLARTQGATWALGTTS
jgi:CDP-glucose 4,6-dehydratase